MEECQRLGVSFRFNTLAEADTVLAEDPGAVIVATGGLPQTEILAEGNSLVASAWDILTRDVPPGDNVLIYDDAGDYAALQAAEAISASGASVEYVTRERTIASEVMSMSLTPSLRLLQDNDVTFTVARRLDSVRRDGNHLTALLGSDYGTSEVSRHVDQVIVNHGTRPLDDLYFDLRPGSINLGEVDYAALIEGRPQKVVRNPSGGYRLFRIGDAVAARNVHAAIYDGNRLLRGV